MCNFYLRGEGIKSGLCLNLCENLYESCKGDLFEAGIVDSGIEYCTGSSLMCYKLDSFVSSGQEFCKRLGYEVKKKNCFDGVSAARIRGKARSSKSEGSDSNLIYLCVLLGIMLLILIVIVYRRKSQSIDIRQKRIDALINRNK